MLDCGDNDGANEEIKKKFRGEREELGNGRKVQNAGAEKRKRMVQKRMVQKCLRKGWQV